MIKLLTFIFITGIIYAQSNAVDILKSVQNKFRQINNLNVEITQTANSEIPLRGKLFFKQPDSYRLELSNQIIITDGKTFSNFNIKQKKLIISNFEKSNDNIFSINYLLFEVPAKSNVSATVDGKLDKLTLKSKEASFPYQFIEIWVDRDKLIRKVRAVENTNTSYEIVFGQYNINQNLKSDIFNFNPPEGTKIIDLR
jgi:chaperone LolA